MQVCSIPVGAGRMLKTVMMRILRFTLMRPRCNGVDDNLRNQSVDENAIDQNILVDNDRDGVGERRLKACSAPQHVDIPVIVMIPTGL